METFSGDIEAEIAEAEAPPKPAERTQAGKLSDLEIAEQVADLLPVHHAEDYASWLEVLMAFHSVDSGAAGLELAKRFSSRCPEKFNESELEKKWRGFNPNGGKRIGTLIKWVQDAGKEIRFYRSTDKPRTQPKPLIPPSALTIKDLARFVTTEDPNTLIGQRWLCRGMGAFLIGQSGIGKSSLSMQAMILWALGLDLFGIKPVRPLRILLIQAENDTGDLAEMLQGVLAGMGMQDRVDELNERLVFITVDSSTGRDFATLLRLAIEKYKPDLVFADPMLSYIGGNISDQETVSAFLRNQINPVLHDTGAALIWVHHTNKPSKDPAQRNGYIGGDFAYLGTGSAELANWARAVLTLREVQEGLYELRGAKRGKRSGLPKDSSGQGYTQFLKHGERGICWEATIDEANEVEAAIVHGEAQGVLEAMRGKTWRHAEIIKLITAQTGKKTEAAKKFFVRQVVRHLHCAVGLYSVR